MVAAIRIIRWHYHTEKLQLHRFIHTWVSLKAFSPPLQFSTVTLFIYLQGFERQRDQGASVGDIFKSPFLANTVSERSTMSLFFCIHDPEVSKYLFWHLRVGGREVMERRWTVDWLPVVWLHLLKLSFFRSLRSLFQPQSSVSIKVRSNQFKFRIILKVISVLHSAHSQRYCVYYIVLINSHEDFFGI